MPKQTGCQGRFLQRQVHNDWTVVRDTFWDAFVQFSNRERQCRAERELHDDQSRDRGPVRLRHLHEARDDTDTVAATAARMACVIEGRFFLSQAQNFVSESSSPPVRIDKITIVDGRTFYLERGSEHYLISGTKKSLGSAVAEDPTAFPVCST